jgi:hypothetical protein
MTISVDYRTRVISVLKSDLTLIQSSPIEILEMDLNWFRMQLKSWEDDPPGMVMPITHNHYAPVSVGGVTLARVVELINGYTVTFEDGQYAVNLVGANSNVGDNVNVNQVSVRSANSAGLLQTREIQYASFQNKVWIDEVNGIDGTLYPAGTPQSPVKTWGDALLIANLYGFNAYQLVGNNTIPAGVSITNSLVFGQNASLSFLNLDPDAYLLNVEFQESTLTGTLDGGCIIRNSVVFDLHYVYGFLFQTMLAPGTVTLGGSPASQAHFLDCYSGVPGSTTPTIDCAGDGPALSIRNYAGGVKLTNKTGNSKVSIDLASGQVKIDLTTVTSGEIVVRGVGKVVEATTGEWLGSGTYGNVTLINETNFGLMLQELWKLQGLDPDAPMTVTPTSRLAGLISQIISGDGTTTTTVTRQ